MPRYLITSALPYINGVKHLGNLIGSMLPGDVYARYLRAQGQEVLYVCATDEHGTPAELAAREASQSVEQYCQEQHLVQKELGERFFLSFDIFGRSSSAQNQELTQHFATALRDQGYIEERESIQLYSPADERYLPDRYVIGTCPHCSFDRARGDQCENCTRVLDPTSLINPRSAISGSTQLEPRATRHLFLQLEKLQGQLKAWIEEHPQWPILTSSIAHKWLTEGLKARGITRDLSWGVPVPFEGFEGKVFYVWFDAPIEYIGATKEWADADPSGGRDWKSWWYEAKDVHHVQFMAKDNIPFHTIMWPGTIMGTKEPWKLADFVKGYNWLTYDGGKFSTSQGRGIFMDTALELLPADYWRWYLIANAPESDDSDFTWDAFGNCVNKELGSTFGNFVNRLAKLSAKHFGAVIPAGGEIGDVERHLAHELDERIATLSTHLEKIEFRKAAAELYLIWQLGNGYLQKSEPWVLAETNKEAAALVLRTGFNLARLYAILSTPFIPERCDTILDALHVSQTDRTWPKPSSVLEEMQRLAPNAPLDEIPVLFPRIAPEQIAAWKEQFSGATEAVSS